jgi:hypothetical protein
MAQAVIAYGAVTAAAGWMVWSMLIPSRLRQALARRPDRGSAAGDGGCDCGGDCCG